MLEEYEYDTEVVPDYAAKRPAVKTDNPPPVKERAIFIELVLVSGQRCEIIIHPDRDETYDDTPEHYWLFEFPRAKAKQRVWKSQIASDTIRDSFIETPAVVPERKSRDGRARPNY